MSLPQSEILIVELPQEVPPLEPGEDPDQPPSSMEVTLSALVRHKQPAQGWLRFRTEGVNLRSHKILVNGKEIGYLRGPGYGQGARGYEERLKLESGILRPGINHVVIRAGERPLEAGAGPRIDRFTIEQVYLGYLHEEAPANWGPLAAGLALLLFTGALLYGRRRG